MAATICVDSDVEVEVVDAAFTANLGAAQRLQQVLDDEALARSLSTDEFVEPNTQVSHDEAFARNLQDSFGSQSLDNGVHDAEDDTSGRTETQAPHQVGKASSKSPVELDLAIIAPEEKSLPPEALHELNTLWTQWLRGEETNVTVKKPKKSRNYKIHALHALLQEFPRAPAPIVKDAFEKFGTYKDAEDELEASSEKERLKTGRGKKQAPPCPIPKVLAKEMKAGYRTDTVSSAFARRKEHRAARIGELRAVGGLGTCGCCFEDELLPEEELRCTSAEGHGFCIPCVRRQALEFFGSKLFTLNVRGNGASSSSAQMEPEPSAGAVDLSSTVLRCMQMSSGCHGNFSDLALRKALSTSEYARYSRRSAALQAAASGLKDLVACPACDFMVEMSDASVSVIRCLDPDCGKITCRWCGEPDHRPLRCDEVEKDGEVKIRTFLEERMAESCMRRCPNRKCQKPYERTEGCNHIKCPCGTHVCYLCGEVLNNRKPYDHYKDGAKGGGTNNGSSQCVVYGTPAWAKKTEEQARVDAEKALEEYLKENPDLQEVMQERTDVLKRTLAHVSESQAKSKRKKKNT